MQETNAHTLQTYQDNFQRYIEGTVAETNSDSFQGRWIADVLALKPVTAKILEIGSAFGRDAQFIISQGYENVETTDAFEAAVGYLRAHGLPARKLNIITDEVQGVYDIIFASAVFLHFTPDELGGVLMKLKGSIVPTGYLVFSVKQGDGEEWSTHKVGGPRYFCFWQRKELVNFLYDHGYEMKNIRETDDGKWLHIIAYPVR